MNEMQDAVSDLQAFHLYFVNRYGVMMLYVMLFFKWMFWWLEAIGLARLIGELFNCLGESPLYIA